MNKDDKTLIGAFLLPIALAVYCLITQEYLRLADKGLCKPPAAGGRFSFDVSDSHTSIFASEVSCSSSETQFFYIVLGFAAFICFGLAFLLPCVIHSRRHPVEKTKLFE